MSNNGGRINSNTIEEQRRAERMERNVRRSRGHDADPVGEDEFLADGWVIEKSQPGIAGEYNILKFGDLDDGEVTMRVERWEVEPDENVAILSPSDRVTRAAERRGSVPIAFVENVGAAHTRIRLHRDGNRARFIHTQPGT